MNIFKRWQRTSIANQLMVLTSALVAFGTLFYVGVAIFQYYLMRESGRQTSEQTDRLIAATKRMADTTVEALNEAKRSNYENATRAEKSISISNKFADAATGQAETSKKAAHAAEISASASEKGVEVMKSGISIANRAYVQLDDKTKFMHPLEANKPVLFVFTFANNGNSPAEVDFNATVNTNTVLKKCDYSGELKFSGKEIIISPKDARIMNVLISSQGFSKTDVDAILNGEKIFQMCLNGAYRTLDSSYHLEQCLFYSPGLDVFLECPKTDLEFYSNALRNQLVK